MAEEANAAFGMWGVLELLGHVRLAGWVTEEERFGAKLGRIDVPLGEGMVTQYFGAGSIYRLTPTTEEIARSVAARNEPRPVHRFELPSPPDRPSAAAERAEFDALDADALDGHGFSDDDCF